MLELILFLLFILLCLYLPGRWFVAKLQHELTYPEELFLSFSFGLIFFTLIAYTFSWAKLEILMLPLFVGLSFLTIRKKAVWIKNFDKKHLKPYLLVITLSILFSLSMLLTGKFGDEIITRRDDLWHLALINELKVHFPPDNPGVAGIPLKGYHFFYNLILAKISNLFYLSPITLYFHLFPLLTALLWGIGVYALLFLWSKKISVALWAVFLTFFGGSFAFLFYLRGDFSIPLNNGLGISQPTILLINPPFAVSIIFLLTALLAIHHYITDQKKRWLIPLTFAIGLVTMIKVYAGIILVGGFLVLTLIEILRRRWVVLSALVGITVLFFSTYWLFSGNAGYLIFYPLWAPHRLLESFTWYGYVERMDTYLKQGVMRGIIEVELFGLGVFLLGNLGTRLLGVLLTPILFSKKKKQLSLFAVVVSVMAIISFMIPLLFIQSGKVFEIIQMSWYFLFITSLGAAFGFAAFFALSIPKKIKIICFLLFIAATIPSALFDFYYYSKLRAQVQSLSSPSFKTFAYLSRLDTYDATVLEMPSQSAINSKGVYRWYQGSNPGIVAFANKRSFLNNEYIDFPGVDTKPRVAFLQQLVAFSKLSPTAPSYKKQEEKILAGLRENKIQYIYSSYEIKKWKKSSIIKMIYQEEFHTIYKVDNN